MLKRYIGPFDEVSVTVAGTEIGIVKRDEAIAIPDDLANSFEWAPELWADGAPVDQSPKGK